MGCQQSHFEVDNKFNKDFIVVATLNYGGILNSPLEFFSDSQAQERQISVIFKSLLSEYVQNFDENTFKWDIGKIDQKIQKQRYAPIYRPNVGLENQKLLKKSQFEKKWDQCYKQAINSKKLQPEPTPIQINNMKLFDLICYHTLLRFVYKINKLEQIETGKYSPKEYLNLTEKYFSRSYLNEQKKIKKVKQSLMRNSADIFCFQEPTKSFIDSLVESKNYLVKQNGQDTSMILIRKSSFKKIDMSNQYLKSVLTDQEYSLLNWDGDTCFVTCDNFIFISGHLSSKKDKNALQIEQMKRSLNTLKKKCSGYHVVVGADTNSFVTSKGIEQFYTYPNAKDEFTTRKKRTFLQPQFSKADSINEQCKDQIFSTLKIIKKKIATIQNQQIDHQQSRKKLLPTQQHPFDHFMVLCSLQKVQ